MLKVLRIVAVLQFCDGEYSEFIVLVTCTGVMHL